MLAWVIELLNSALHQLHQTSGVCGLLKFYFPGLNVSLDEEGVEIDIDHVRYIDVKLG